VGAGACAALATLAVASAAKADSPLTWTGPLQIDATNIVQAVSCPSTTLCVAVDNAGNTVTTTDPSDGATATWTVKNIGPSDFWPERFLLRRLMRV